MSRPCRYCTAAYPSMAAEMCGWQHRDEQRVYDLATAMARLFQRRVPTDEQIGWFAQDADAVVDDFDPVPEKWHLRRLPQGKYDEFDVRFRINDVTYVIQSSDSGEYVAPSRLSTYREWIREANRRAVAS